MTRLNNLYRRLLAHIPGWRLKCWLAGGLLLSMLIVPAVNLMWHWVDPWVWLPLNMLCGWTSGNLVTLALNERHWEQRKELE